MVLINSKKGGGAMSEEKEKQTESSNTEASFLIRIQYRQNASWQGTIQWLEEKKTKQFRSELEMMMLINEAADKVNIQTDRTKLGSWNKKEEVS
jgi:predicted Rdx family selenoprotein